MILEQFYNARSVTMSLWNHYTRTLRDVLEMGRIAIDVLFPLRNPKSWLPSVRDGVITRETATNARGQHAGTYDLYDTRDHEHFDVYL